MAKHSIFDANLTPAEANALMRNVATWSKTNATPVKKPKRSSGTRRSPAKKPRTPTKKPYQLKTTGPSTSKRPGYLVDPALFPPPVPKALPPVHVRRKEVNAEMARARALLESEDLTQKSRKEILNAYRRILEAQAGLS